MAPQLPSLTGFTALSCHVLNNQIPEGRKYNYQETRSSWPIIPYLNHAGGEADDLLEERGISQVYQDPLVLEHGIRFTQANI